MKREDLNKLLGGYAAGTLTDAERRALFDAALTDQSLFNALADEESLRDALADPGTRAHVRAALDAVPARNAWSWTAWLRRPQAWALAASLAGAIVLCVVLLRPGAPPQRPAELAKVVVPTPPPVLQQAQPAPAPQQKLRRAQEPARRVLPPPPPIPASNDAAVPAIRSDKEEQAFAPAAPPPPPPAPAMAAARMSVAESIEVQANAAMLAQKAGGKLEIETSRKGLAQPPLSLRYVVLRRNRDGKYVEVSPQTVLSCDDDPRLRIHAGASGYLYVLNGDKSLYRGPVSGGIPVTVPARPGKIQLILSREPDPDPAATVAWSTRQ